jgi:hypothetical protein
MLIGTPLPVKLSEFRALGPLFWIWRATSAYSVVVGSTKIGGDRASPPPSNQYWLES